MPELAEVKIVSDYINSHSSGRTYSKMFHVQRGNIPVEEKEVNNFKIIADSNGKELILTLNDGVKSTKISVFMGMSGNWIFTPTGDWEKRKFTRLRFDTTDGNSLLLWGLYMGPKYKIGGFSTKRGPDPTKEFDQFKKNILQNLDSRIFDKPICEALLEQKFFNGIGAYLCSEIVGRIDIDPFEQARKVIKNNPKILLLCRDIPIESYNLGGGELFDWKNPFGESKIFNWLKFYGKKDICCKQKFGKRNIWIQNKYVNNYT